jgi:hypothetical protein
MMLSRILLALILLFGIACATATEARMRAPKLSFTKTECSLLGGGVDDLGGGRWACCFEESGQCWNCSGETGGPATGHCDCLGDGCPSDKSVQPGLNLGPMGGTAKQN